MKAFESIVVILLVVILGIQIYDFIRTRENINKAYLEYQALEPYNGCGADGVCITAGGLESGVGEGV